MSTVGAGLLAYYLGRDLGLSHYTRVVVLIAGVTGLLVLVAPRYGLYAFSFTLILIPFDWRIAGLKLTSPNTILIGAALVGWAGALALRRSRLQYTNLYVPLLIILLVAWLNLLRYGRPFFLTPYILSEALLLFLLAFHLIRDHQTVRQFLVVVALGFAIRTALDVGQAAYSVFAGATITAIRLDRLWLGGTSTSGSEWRSLFLPVFLALFLMTRRGSARTLFGAALLIDVAWLALAATRTGLIGLVLGPLGLLLLLPRTERRKLSLTLLPVGGLALYLLIVFTSNLSQMLTATRTQPELGGRRLLWIEALQAFLRNPLWGDSPGPSHSYFLGTGRTMGLAYLVPLGIALYMIWRHAAWLRTQPLDRHSEALVAGVQAGLLVSIVLNATGTMFQSAFNAFFFWMLVGAVEAIYIGVRAGHRDLVEPAERASPPA
jgi:hypothetical protein